MVGAESPTSVAAALVLRATQTPDRTAYVFLAEGEEEQERLTYAGLDARARAIAAALSRSVAAGERALLLYPPGLDFVAAFFGCLYAGVIAVPAYPPRSQRMMPRLLAILADAEPAVALAASTSLQRVRGWLERTPEGAAVSWITTDELDPAPAGWSSPVPDEEAVAFLQYTSGSTSTPKGVMVTHANLVHNQQLIQDACGHSEESVFVSWLPVYHDLGLIGNLLQATWVGAPCVLMSPVAFLQKPSRWLWAISRYRGTTSGGPNFAYDLCVRRAERMDLAEIDLSSWRVAFNGAEPVLPSTLERFAAAFVPHGFRAAAAYPCYGLAEATLMVSGGSPADPPRVGSFSAAALERGLAEPAEPGEPGARPLAGCGQPLGDQAVIIVNPETAEPLPSGRIGEIWIAGPSVARGYWKRPEETAEIFGARLAGSKGRAEGPAFLRTGDLGFLRGGELYVTGRIKDLIILRGRNFYPQDIELTVESSHPDLRAGCGAAFSVEVAGEERLVVVQEIERRRQDRVDVEAVAEAIRRTVAEEHEAQVHEVVLLAAGAVPKTSSGKIQRHACRAGYLEGGLATVGRSAAALAAGGEEDALALDRGALLALRPEHRQATVETFLAERIARLTGVSGTAGAPVDGRSLISLGLDSLMVIELRNTLEAGLGVEVPMSLLFQGSGLAELAAEALARLGGGAAEETAAVAAPEPEGGERPLTPGQKGLWLLDRLASDSGVCNLGGAARLRSPLDPDALRQAFVRLARRHPALRTVFGSRSEEPWQRIEADLEPGFAVHDASDWRGAELEGRLLAEIYRPFDLARGPLVRAAVWTLAPGEAILSLAAHHLISDLWSVVVMLRDLGALYEEESGGALADLPPLPLSPAGHLHWQERFLAGERGERQWCYWSERLAAPLPVVELPADRLRPPIPSYSGSSIGLRVPDAVASRLRELARRGDATLYTVLLGAFLALVHRQTGQEDLLIGSPTSGRNVPGCEPLVGYLVNPVVLRAGVDGDAPFASLLGGVRETVLGAFGHQDYPFELLAERLQGARDTSRSPLFQLAFVFQKPHLPELAGLGAFALGEEGGEVPCGPLRLESVALPQARVQFDLSLVMAERDGGLGAAFQYAADLFDRATIERLARQMGILLEGIAADPRRAVGDLSLLSAPEERELLMEWNLTDTDAPRDLCLHELFEAQVERTPEAVAVICGEDRWIYRELEDRANRLAHHLRSLGVGPETRVGVCLERSASLIAALLGVLKAGGAYVPLDPAYPDERIALMLEDSRAAVLLTRESLDRDREALAAASAERPGRSAEPGHLAYVIYTSGSTGRPKGVAIEHGAPVVLSSWARGLFGPEALSRVLASTSVCFDLSVFEIFVPLSWGGAVVLVENALSLIGAPAADEVTLINTVPSALTELLRQEALPASAATVSLAGEPLPRALARQAYAVSSVRRLFNLYGPSEDTTYSTFALVDADGSTPPAIGRPIAGTRSYVLDRRLRPVPVGVPGELCLGGRGLARGYLGRPELTAERFIPDPFGAAGGRLYRTGDLVRWRPDGELEFLGRLDHQVKIRGFRIELGEVESCLAAHPEVRDTVVLAREDAVGERRLVAYVVGETPAPAVPELRRHLRRSLPEHMVPSAFVLLPALPLTPNGKVDRRALPAPGQSAQEGEVAPRTPVEEVIAGIWAEVLGLEQVGATDHFFLLGGHSLLATRVLSRLRSVFGIEMTLRDLFETPVLAGLATRVEAVLRTGAGRLTPPLGPLPRQGPLPLSFAQQRLWFIDQLEPGSPLYNIPAALRAEGSLNATVLALCLGEIVRRHEALRTVFAARDGAPEQVIRPAVPFALPLVDLSGLPQSRREETALSLAGEEARRPFDLAHGPLLRGMLLRLATEDHIAALTMHHIVSDGWSMGILVREVTALYAAFTEGRPSPLPDLPVQYADFAIWQHSWLRGKILENEISFWRRQLAGLPPLLELPSDRPRPPVQSFQGASRQVRLPAELTRQLKRLSRCEEVTLFMVLLAAFQTLLARSNGQRDLAVGTPVAGRDRMEVEGLIGFFVNTLVLRGDLAGEIPFRKLLRQVREITLATYAHQDLPFEKLVQELSPERNLAHSPLFQVMFTLQNFPSEGIELAGLSLSPVALETVTVKFDLELTFTEVGDGLSARFDFASDLFDPSTILRLVGHLLMLLEAVTAEPDRHLGELPLLSESERHHLQCEWNDAPALAAPGVVELFKAQVRRSPDAVAVVLAGEEGEGFTYRELDRRAGILAERLRALGVGPEVPVGLCIEHGPELAVAVLGIFRSGGAYVPLDPAHPPTRLTFLLEDSAVPVLVTQLHLLASLPPHGAQVVLLDGEGTVEESCVSPEPAPGDLAYRIYTSGTTGQPKAVQIEHGMLAATLAATRGLFHFAAGDRMPCLARSTFDISLFELLSPLLSGGTAVLFPLRPTLDVELVVDHLREMTCLHAVPGLMRGIIESLRRRGAAAPDMGRMRAVFVGGDAVPAELLEDLLEIFSAARVWVLYGPTEGTIVCAAHPVPPPPVSARLLLGRPLAGAVLDVRDPNGELLPVGVPGELWIGGAGVTRGYLGRDALTAEKYVLREGARFYRSGDRARWRPDGELEFLGRLDHQVKIRGFRIEPGEIEAVLHEHGAVQEAVVDVEEHAGDRRLVAWIVPVPALDRLFRDSEIPGSRGSGPADLPLSLRAHLAQRLPEYMLPTAFVTLAALPLTPHGKVDRRALPAPGWQHSEEIYQTPQTPVEEVLSGIWADLLGLERVGATAHFFDLGGHSLLAIQVMSRLRGAFGVEMSPRDLFEAPILADLAARIEAARRSATVLPPPPLVPLPRKGPLPLSFAQQRLWFLHQIDPLSPAYHLHAAVELCGPLDVAALGAALSEIVRRHEALRTGFEEIDGQPVQVVASAHPVPLALVDMTGVAGPDHLAIVRALAVQQVMLPFTLAQAPLIRVYLVRFDDTHHTILLTVHHIVSDGWSMELMIREVTILYQVFLAGCPSPLPELPVQYADFALWQRSWLSGETIGTLSHYWKSRLAGAPALLELPLDRKRPPLPDNRGALRPYTIPQDLSDSLKRVARTQRVTLFMVLLAAFKALLHSYSGQEDMVVGTNIAGRASAEVEGLIGFFINMLALRTDLSGNPTFTELLQRVREITLGAYSHQEMPFEKVVDELRLERRLSHTPLFQAVLTLQPAVALDEMAATPELTLRPLGLDVSATPFDLIFNLSKTATGVSGSVIYSVRLFKAATIKRLMERYSALLRLVVAAPERRLSEIREALFEGMTGEQEREFDVAARRAFKSARRQAVTLASKVST